MDEYDCVKKSSLKFKGEKRKKKSKGSKTKSENPEDSTKQNEKLVDADLHGCWWKVEKYEQLKEDVALELLPSCYAKALNNGRIILGDVHPPGEGPDEEEIFTVIRFGAGKFALKSGYGRYLSVDRGKSFVGLSEAISEQETFTAIFEEEKSALRSFSGYFISLDEECKSVLGSTEEAEVTFRVNYDPQQFDNNKKARLEI